MPLMVLQLGTASLFLHRFKETADSKSCNQHLRSYRLEIGHHEFEQPILGLARQLLPPFQAVAGAEASRARAKPMLQISQNSQIKIETMK